MGYVDPDLNFEQTMASQQPLQSLLQQNKGKRRAFYIQLNAVKLVKTSSLLHPYIHQLCPYNQLAVGMPFTTDQALNFPYKYLHATLIRKCK